MAGCARGRLRVLLKLLAVLSACLPSRSANTSFQYAGQQGTWPVGVSQCSWDEQSGRCKPTYVALMAATAPVVKTENYPARAEAQLAAGKLYCGQFNEGKCAWPCQWNGEECTLVSTKIYGCWDCPGSLAYQSKFCNQLPNAVPDKCNKLPGCKFIQPATPGAASRCDSIFFAGKDADFTVAWYGNYYSLVPREYVGCCKGSNYRWLREKSCQVKISGDASVAQCKKKQGCYYDDVQLTCNILEDQLVQYAFSEDSTDPARQIMLGVAKECMAITDSNKCDNHAPVKIDSKQIKLYLEQDLGGINSEVADKQCKPQPDLVAPIIASGSDAATPWPTSSTPRSKIPSPSPKSGSHPSTSPSPRSTAQGTLHKSSPKPYKPATASPSPKPKAHPSPSPKPKASTPHSPAYTSSPGPTPELQNPGPCSQSTMAPYGYGTTVQETPAPGCPKPSHLVAPEAPSPKPKKPAYPLHRPKPHVPAPHSHRPSPSPKKSPHVPKPQYLSLCHGPHHVNSSNSTNCTYPSPSPTLVKSAGKPKPVPRHSVSPSPSPSPKPKASNIPGFIPGIVPPGGRR